jgi:ASC-1-like (ASCH) protein
MLRFAQHDIATWYWIREYLFSEQKGVKPYEQLQQTCPTKEIPMPHVKTLWVKDEYLQQILSGRKTVEVRVAYSNVARLEPGDRLLLNGQYPYLITAIRRYPDFEALVAAEDAAAIAPDRPEREALLAACRAIYPPDREALGVVALQIAAHEGHEE